MCAWWTTWHVIGFMLSGVLQGLYVGYNVGQGRERKRNANRKGRVVKG